MPGCAALALVVAAGCAHPTVTPTASKPRVYLTIQPVGPTHGPQPDYCTALAWRSHRGVVAKVWTDEPSETVRLTLHGDGPTQTVIRKTNGQWETGASFSMRRPRTLVIRVGAAGPDPLATTARILRFDTESVDCR